MTNLVLLNKSEDIRTPTKFYMGSPLRKRDESNMCSKMPHVHVFCCSEARSPTGGLCLHILSVCVWGACMRTRARFWSDGVPAFLWF